MAELKTVLRWLRYVAMFQSTLIFLVFIVLTEKLSTVRRNLLEALYTSNAPTEQVDKINQTLFSISSLAVWFFIIGIACTGVTYGFLSNIIRKTWPAPTSVNQKKG